MKKEIEFDKKCGVAIDFIPNDIFKEEIENASSLDELSNECREFVELCYKNKEKFRKELFENLEYPKELKKFIK